MQATGLRDGGINPPPQCSAYTVRPLAAFVAEAERTCRHSHKDKRCLAPGCGCQAVTDETLKKLDATYLRDLRLQGVERIQKVFLRQSKALFPDLSAPTGFRSEDEWVLDTEGVNLMGVSVGACLLVTCLAQRHFCCHYLTSAWWSGLLYTLLVSL